jgi:AcrR family transcriptional regulator
MARWQPDARGRLMQAALELYGERGFDRTTVAEIAERAGLTERTFFRHFADKREVLFSGEVDGRLMEALAAAPPEATPMQAVAAALEAAGDVLEQRRERALRRQAVIAATPSLRERELVKLATLAERIAGVLRERGADPVSARLTAEAGMAVYRTAFDRWIEADDPPPFGGLVRESLAGLERAIAA